MAEALGVSLGALQILSAGIAVSQSLFKYFSEVKHQDEEIKSTTERLQDLNSTLESLKKVLQENSFGNDKRDARLRDQLERSFEMCKGRVSEMERVYDKLRLGPDPSFIDKMKHGARRHSYPFEKTTFTKLNKDIGGMLENLTVGLHELQIVDINQIKTQINEVKAPVEELYTSIVSDSIHRWLKPPDAAVDQREASTVRAVGSGLWLVEGLAFKDWLESRNSFLWLSGGSGSGKSVLCSSAIDQVLQFRGTTPGIGVGFFYFTVKDKEKQGCYGMLVTLLLQLANQVDSRDVLADFEARHRPAYPTNDALLKCLQRLAEKFREVYILVDAVDESDQSRERQNILSALAKIRGWETVRIHLFISSRPESGVREKLYPSSSETITMDNGGVYHDIEWYIRSQLRSREGLQKWESEYSEIQETLLEKAEGNFRWVACQFGALEECDDSISALRKTLNSLPITLGETYERMLRSNSRSAKKILAFVCYSERPLRVDEMLDATAIDLDPEPRVDSDSRIRTRKNMLSLCEGLVEEGYEERYTQNGWAKVEVLKVSHASVMDYLESEELSTHSTKKMFSMKKEKVHDELTQACLTYLLDDQLLETCRTSRDSRESPLATHPLANYAAMYWYRHYKRVTAPSEKTKQLVRKLLVKDENAFHNWIRIWDPDRVLRNQRYVFPNFDRRSTQIPTPAYYASLLGLSDMLSELISKGGSHRRVVTASGTCDAVNAAGGLYGNPLQAAAFNGDEKIVELLLREGANINATGGLYGTALQAAILEDRMGVVQLLLENHADVNATGGVFGTALQAACFKGFEDLARQLLEKGAVVDAVGGTEEYFGTALQAACFTGHQNLVQLLLEHGADLNKVAGDFYGTTLVAASLKGEVAIAALVLEKGALANTRAGYFGNAIQAASFKGHMNVVKLLFESGADVDFCGGECGTALQAACAEGHVQIVRLLIDRGADVDMQGGKYGNALQAACFHGHFDVVKVLLDNGADIAAQGYFGDPRTAAAREGNTNVGQLLLDYSETGTKEATPFGKWA